MNKGGYVGWTAAFSLALFLAYDFGKSNGRNEVLNANLVEECANTRYSELEELKAKVVDYSTDLAANRAKQPLDLTIKRDLKKFKEGLAMAQVSLISLRETCKGLVAAGVTDFTLNSDNDFFTPEMKRRVIEQYLELLRRSAGVAPAANEGKGQRPTPNGRLPLTRSGE